MRPRSLRHSIGTKIFVAFLAMSAIIGAIGAYGYWVLLSAGTMVTGTYDGPLMAINYARAASVDFVEMQQAVLRRKLSSPPGRAAIDEQIDALTANFFSDVKVANDRMTDSQELSVVKQIRRLVKAWQDRWHRSGKTASDPALDALNSRIMDRFDYLIELNADRSFVGRRKAVWAIGYFKYALIGVTGLALLLSLSITLVLARRIMRPLSSAVEAANRIASGEFETSIPHAGKDETGVLLQSMTVMQGNIRTMVEREKARAESAESRLAHALETAQEGVVLVGPDNKILIANNTIRGFFPSVADRLVAGGNFDEVLRLAWNDIRDHGTVPAPQKSRTGAVSLVNVEHQLKDGRWIRTTGSRTDDDSLICFVSDFTAVKEREENFQRATLAAQEASAAKSRFLANMSHELRTPLNAIIGFSEILSGQIFGALGNQRYVDYARDIQQSGRNLLGVINSVLEISRSESGKQDFATEPVDLGLVLRDCAARLAGKCEAGRVAFRLDESGEALVMEGDQEKVRQIFDNLMSNAVKFTQPGGRVAVTVHLDGSHIVAEVADTGIGMSPEDIEIALTPFGQVDNRLERKYEGVGLGLPLAKSLIERHGGALEIRSERGVGTVMRVSFPAAAHNHEREATSVANDRTRSI